jgi:hypothetical protein
MKVVFIGCEFFAGTDKCGFNFDFYQSNFKIGDKFDLVGGDTYPYVYIKIHLLEKSGRKVEFNFPAKYFVTLDEWREIQMDKIGIKSE